jgi:monoamine oxidase
VLKYHYEDWGSCAFIEGLYSYPLPGIMPNYREIIGRPIKNKIYFCGEAYHHYQPSTIHGAYESAISTAKDLINYDLIQLV